MTDDRDRPILEPSNGSPEGPPSLRLIALVVIAYTATVLINGLICILLAELFGWFGPEANTETLAEVTGVPVSLRLSPSRLLG